MTIMLNSLSNREDHQRQNTGTTLLLRANVRDKLDHIR